MKKKEIQEKVRIDDDLLLNVTGGVLNIGNNNTPLRLMASKN